MDLCFEWTWPAPSFLSGLHAWLASRVKAGQKNFRSQMFCFAGGTSHRSIRPNGLRIEQAREEKYEAEKRKGKRPFRGSCVMVCKKFVKLKRAAQSIYVIRESP